MIPTELRLHDGKKFWHVRIEGETLFVRRQPRADQRRGQARPKLELGECPIRALALAGLPNGRYAAIYDGSGGLALIEVDSDALAFWAEHRLFGQRGAVEFGPAGMVVTSGGGMLGRWDTGLETD